MGRMELTFGITANITCRVGWNPEAKTYFGEVYPVKEDGTPDREIEKLRFVGTGASKDDVIPDIDTLEHRLQPYQIPDDIRAELASYSPPTSRA